MQKRRLSGSVLLLAVVAIAGCGGAGAANHNYSGAIVHSIQTNGVQQIRRATNGLGRYGMATIIRASCVQTRGTQSYFCIVHYTFQNSEGTYGYEVNVSATCHSGGTCRWHVDGGPTLVSAEPD